MSLQKWHQGLGHLNKRDITKVTSVTDGIVIGDPPIPTKLSCAGCLVGKDHRQVSRIPRPRPSRLLEVVFADICGPMRMPGLLGAYVYFIVFVDGYCGFVWLFCFVSKDQCRIIFLEWSAIQERYTGLSILILFTDNEKSLHQMNFQGILVEKGI